MKAPTDWIFHHKPRYEGDFGAIGIRIPFPIGKLRIGIITGRCEPFMHFGSAYIRSGATTGRIWRIGFSYLPPYVEKQNDMEGKKYRKNALKP